MSTTSAINTQSATPTTNPKAKLKVEDFINLMVTQLQNQDPTSPASNSELLQQMSQIGQLQSQDDLQSSMKSLVLQNNIGSASNLIGKHVTGVSDTTGDEIDGQVKSISVVNGAVTLKLDGGETLSMSKVTGIEQSATNASDLSTAVSNSAGATAAP